MPMVDVDDSTVTLQVDSQSNSVGWSESSQPVDTVRHSSDE